MTAVWTAHAWISTIKNPATGAPNTNNTPLASNVIALIVWPRLSPVDDPPSSTSYDGGKLASNAGAITPAPYTYDSQYQSLVFTQWKTTTVGQSTSAHRPTHDDRDQRGFRRASQHGHRSSHDY